MNIASTSPTLRVLIIDDNRDAADTLAVLLEVGPLGTGSRSRLDVRVAYNGIEGLQTALAFVPDCVVSDIRMPGMDGYALARAIRSEPALAGTKLVALSAFASAEHERLATEAGFQHRLTKPGDVEQLLEVLQMIEEIKELAKQNVELAGQTKELIQEVKENVQELKQEVKELKQDVKELKDDQKDQKDDGAAPAH